MKAPIDFYFDFTSPYGFRTHTEVDAAVARGVCGSPYVVIDGEPFWGVDRFEPDGALARDWRILR